MKTASSILLILFSIVASDRLSAIAQQRSPKTPIADRVAPIYTDAIGTKVSIVKPPGFTNADNFPGFQQTASGASIAVTELPAGIERVTAGFNTASLKSRGMNLLSQAPIEIDGNRGLLLQVSQSASLVEVNKWIVVFGDERQSVILVATYPIDAAAELGRSLKQSLVSAKWQRNKVVDPFADLKFAIASSPQLKFAQRVQNALLYTKDGRIPANSVADPLLVVSPSAKVLIGDTQQYAQKRITQIAQVKNLKIDATKQVTIGGLSGYEILATARDRSTDTPLAVYQVMLFEGQSYYLIQGLVGSSLKAKYLPEFQQMAASFCKR